MKSAVIATLILVALFGTGVAQSSTPASVAGVSAHKLSRHDAQRLVFSATTPEEHRQLAEYYRQEAERQRKNEQHYLDTEVNYRLHPPRADSYRNSPTSALYRELADNAAQLAFADDQLARYQDRLARDLESAKQH